MSFKKQTIKTNISTVHIEPHCQQFITWR